jgi:hypothetical protein
LADLRAALFFGMALRVAGLRAVVFFVVMRNPPLEADDSRRLYQPPGGTSSDCTVDQARSSRHARKNALGSVSPPQTLRFRRSLRSPSVLSQEHAGDVQLVAWARGFFAPAPRGGSGVCARGVLFGRVFEWLGGTR